MKDPNLFEDLVAVSPGMEIWWDSSPVIFGNWCEKMLAKADDADQDVLKAQFARMYNLDDPMSQLFRGVTTNPPLSLAAIKDDPPRWEKVAQQVLADNPGLDTESLFWLLYKQVVKQGSDMFLPLFEASGYKEGFLSGQVDPRSAFDGEAMLKQALEIHAVNPNVMVKVPGTAEGYPVIEELTSLGLLERSRDRYVLGRPLFELGELVPVKHRLREAALPFMQDLYEATHETIHLGVRDDLDVLYVEKIRGHSGVDVPSRPGGRLPLSSTGVGKTLLAFSRDDVVAQVVGRPLRRLTEHSITDPKVLEGELAQIRAAGVGYDHEEASIGVSCVAAPVIVHGEHSDIKVHAGMGVAPFNLARRLQQKAGAAMTLAGDAEALRRVAFVLDVIDPGTEGVVFAQIVFARRTTPVMDLDWASEAPCHCPPPSFSNNWRSSPSPWRRRRRLAAPWRRTAARTRDAAGRRDAARSRARPAPAPRDSCARRRECRAAR